MKRQIAISFENDVVKVIYAQTGRSGIVVEKTLSFSPDEFDRFLATTKDDEFIVVQNFQSLHQDIISVPPAKDKFLRQLVELEIKKRIPELTDFSFFHVVLRDVQREGRKSRDIFFLAVENSEIQEIIDHLARHGKVPAAICCNVLPLSSFLQVADGEPDEPLMGVLDVGTNKTIFLAQGRRLSFVRVAQSGGPGFDQSDIENINMTIAYCRQVLRLNPARVVFLNARGRAEMPAAPIIPVAELKYPPTISAFDDTVREYVAPLSAIIHRKEIEEGNLLPETYRDVVIQRKVMAYCILILALLSFLGVAYVAFQSVEIMRSRKTIAELRSDIGKRQRIIGDFEGTLSGLQKFTPSIEMANSFSSAVNMQDALVSMQVLAMEGIDVRSIALKNEKESVMIQVQGRVRAATYEQLQSRYERFLGEIRKMGKAEVLNQKLDLNQRSFTVDLKWKT